MNKSKNLIDAMVILDFYSDTSPFVITMEEGKAIIMPMDINKANEYFSKGE
jgi:hypothetical protein